MLIKVQAQMQVLVAYTATAEMRDGARRRSLAAALQPLKVTFSSGSQHTCPLPSLSVWEGACRRSLAAALQSLKAEAFPAEASIPLFALPNSVPGALLLKLPPLLPLLRHDRWAVPHLLLHAHTCNDGCSSIIIAQAVRQ